MIQIGVEYPPVPVLPPDVYPAQSVVPAPLRLLRRRVYISLRLRQRLPAGGDAHDDLGLPALYVKHHSKGNAGVEVKGPFCGALPQAAPDGSPALYAGIEPYPLLDHGHEGPGPAHSLQLRVLRQMKGAGLPGQTVVARVHGHPASGPVEGISVIHQPVRHGALAEHPSRGPAGIIAGTGLLFEDIRGLKGLPQPPVKGAGDKIVVKEAYIARAAVVKMGKAHEFVAAEELAYLFSGVGHIAAVAGGIGPAVTAAGEAPEGQSSPGMGVAAEPLDKPPTGGNACGPGQVYLVAAQKHVGAVCVFHCSSPKQPMTCSIRGRWKKVFHLPPFSRLFTCPCRLR